MGTRAFSHDSIFIPDGQAENEQAVQAMSQDKILGKVKTLQQQLSKTIKFGQPPQMTISERTMEEANASLEEDLLLSSPMEIETQQDTVLSDSDNKLNDNLDSLNPMSVPGTGHEVEKKVTPVKSSRSKRYISSGGTIESINLDAVPQAVARLDNSAAKHKLSIRPKKQRLSRKHRRLTKQENPETHQYRERYPDDKGHIGTAKPTQNREGQKQLELVDEKRKQEDHWRMLEAKEKRQIAEAEEKKHLEEQRFQEIEEMQREQERKRCEEEKRQHLLEEEKHFKIKEQRHQEEKKRQQEEWRRQELEEQKRLEERRRQELEGQKRLEERRQRQELEEQKRLEEFRQQEQQEGRQVELEEQKIKELEEQRCHEIEKQHQEEQKRQELEEQKQEFEKRHLQAEQKLQQEEEAKRLEEQSQHQKEKQKRQEEQTLQKLEKQKTQEEQRRHEPAEQMHLESEEREQQGKFKIRQEESNEQELKEQTEIHVDGQQHLEKQEEQQEQAIRQQQVKEAASSGDAGRESMEKQLQEESNQQKPKQSQKGKETVQEKLTPKQKREVEAQEQKIGEELRWQEVDERQAMHRPFTFQVSSGEKQIIFQKVNLSPVTPVIEAAQHSTLKESKTHKFSKGSTALPYSLCVPHTAILVTGAQLCGTAVNLNQIKDTACKSLLGLTEERKNLDIPPPESAQKTTLGPKSSRSKMKYTQETLNNQDILAEWASIRSRILRSAENSKLNEKDRVSVCRYSDDWTPKGRGASHGNLRKTLSANAKFSITPAWQKFSETSKANNTRKKTDSSNDANDDVAAHYETSACKDNATEMATKSETHFIMANNTEGYKFAKDLPSFLVPSLSHSPGKELPQSESPATLESQQNTGTQKLDKTALHEEENISPFGIKLRRTNYSLRFHYDQQAEQKKKKRYSAGDSFDGVLAPLVTTESGKETMNTALKDNISPSLEREDATINVLKDSSNNVLENSETTVTLLFPSINSQIPLPSHEKPVCKSSLQQKPALAPKPANQTPPSSPLSKMNRSNLADTLGQRAAKPESDTTWKKEDSKVNVVHSPAQNENKNEEEETREKKSFFSSITMPWRERPVLQSRHSLDGSKLMEKVESAQPLWITLALQKQKGFREQQATREERRQAREAKQAEKLAAVSNQSDNKGSNISKTSVLQKPTPQEDEKKIEMGVSRLERREQLKKSNTLPTSVTGTVRDLGFQWLSNPCTVPVAPNACSPSCTPNPYIPFTPNLSPCTLNPALCHLHP
uniref:Capping protein inhibiting regulator of actin dynamics n=1 Tax=Gopherus evgoodei TaxID=1825980 RepID=A0A8C4VJK6_9SAUR